MDIKHETSKVAKSLLLPVNKIEFTDNDTVMVFVTNRSIGEIPYHDLPNGRSYDTQKAAVNWLKWDQIISENKELFLNKAKELDSSIDHLTIGDFRRMYAKDEAGTVLYSVEFKYDHNEWSVFKG